MPHRTSSSSKHLKAGQISTSLWFVLALCQPVLAAPVSYTYDNLNRVTEANYSVGQQIITYSYDAAGNMLSRTIGGQAPILTVISPANGTYVNSPSVTIAGTATDAGRGGNGIASVTVNTLVASGGTASGSATANWSKVVVLGSGQNTFTVIATDGNASAYQSTVNMTLTYIPFVIDGDGDGLDDSYEFAIGTNSNLADTDGDGIKDGQELAFDGNGSFFNGQSDIDPLLADTDGDGVKDGAEVAAGTNPLDSTSYPNNIHDGDLNADGAVNLADVLLAQQILSGKLGLTQGYLDSGDVAPLLNGVPAPDGIFNLGDLIVIQRKAQGLESF